LRADLDIGRARAAAWHRRIVGTAMAKDRARPSRRPSRRGFLRGAATVGAAALAMPRLARAQPMTWRYQSTWSTKDIFHEFAVDYARKVNALSGGRLRLEVLSAGAVIPTFQMADAVHAGILDAAHGVCAFSYGKHKAWSLFGTPPSFGWDAHGLLAWFYHGGGEALYRELVNGILRLNIVGLLYFPMPTQPLGWFKKPVRTADDFREMKYRSVGLSAELFREMGADVTILPGGEVVRAMEAGVLDAAELNNPSSDLAAGLADASQVYMMGSHHQPAEQFEILFNKTRFEALPAELQAILRHAALAASTDQLGIAYDRYARDLDEIRRRGINVVKTGASVLDAQLLAWDRVIAMGSRDPFFAKVIASQKAWVQRTAPYLLINNLDSAALQTAYRHFFG
jgi:TRAP-type mannitol/chloroaromatic compound transport system substrate-binding protein